DDVGRADEIFHRADNGGERQSRCDFGTSCRIGNRHDLGAELDGLGDQGRDRRRDTEADHSKPIGFGSNDVEGLGPNGAGRTGDRHSYGTHDDLILAPIRFEWSVGSESNYL
ncbi:MAG: hypothetical protein RL391_1840, partial [Actinomycetota bacterium]